VAQLTFDVALQYLKEGGKVSRQAWLNPKYIYLDADSVVPFRCVTHDNKRSAYFLSSEDILTDDWVFVLNEDSENCRSEKE
jgi:CTP:phosphocholine cytidylyltransferase-like protein